MESEANGPNQENIERERQEEDESDLHEEVPLCNEGGLLRECRDRIPPVLSFFEVVEVDSMTEASKLVTLPRLCYEIKTTAKPLSLFYQCRATTK